MSFKQKVEQLWKRIGDVLQFRELAIIFGGGSFAAAVARYANARNLLAFFGQRTKHEPGTKNGQSTKN